MLTFWLVFVLSGCSNFVDKFNETEWDTVIDNMINVAVDSLLEKDTSNSNMAGNTPPTPPENLAVSQEATTRYYNLHSGNGQFYFEVYSHELVTQGGGWDVKGMLLQKKVLAPETLENLWGNPDNSRFTYDFKDHDNAGTVVPQSVEAKSLGFNDYNCVKLEYTLYGQKVNVAVEESGVVTNEFGYPTYDAMEFVTFQVPFGCEMIDGDQYYSNISNFHEARNEGDEEYMPNFKVLLTVSDSKVVALEFVD